MANDVVNNYSDDATVAGTLRYELAHAQNGDTISFDPAAFTNDKVIMVATPLNVAASVTIDGSLGAGSEITLDGGGFGTPGMPGIIPGQPGYVPPTTIMDVAAGATVLVEDLTFANGKGTGANGAPGAPGASAAGAIVNAGHLTVSNDTFSNDSATGGNGGYGNTNYGMLFPGMPSSPATVGGAGGDAAGAILNAGALTVTGSTFSNDSATGGDGGAGGSNYSFGSAAGGGAGGNAAGAIFDESGTTISFSSDSFSGDSGKGGSGGFGGGGSEGFGGAGGAGGTNGPGARGADGRSYFGFSAPDGGAPGQPGGSSFSGGGGGGGNGTPDVACFVSGTLIRTARGEVAVEHLAVGDFAVTASGEERPIRWIGTRSFECARHADPSRVWPVRIAAHALGDGRPRRDLFVSPDHSLLADDVLIPAKCLINGATITQDEIATVVYWHVELDSHDLLVAEGLEAESYIDTGNRASFAGAGVPIALHPDFAPGTTGPSTTSDYCRPYVDAGPILARARNGLAERAQALGWALEPFAADLHLLADGVRIEPRLVGGDAYFALPAAAREVRLVSNTFVPRDLAAERADARRLGVLVRGLQLGLPTGGHRAAALDDPGLDRGFHAVETTSQGPVRWTDGDATLDPALWAGLDDIHTLRVNFYAKACRVWAAAA